MSLSNIGLDNLVVGEEQSNSYVEEDQIHPIAKADCFLICLPNRLDSSFLISNQCKELRLLKESLSQLTFAQIIISITDGRIKNGQRFLVCVFHIVKKLSISRPLQ